MPRLTKGTRRRLLKQMGAAVGLPFLTPNVLRAEDGQQSKKPKRIIFFLQNHGFSPIHATPSEIDIPLVNHLSDFKFSPSGTDPWHFNGTSLDRVEDLDYTRFALPKWIDPLEPYKDMLTFVGGLNGTHINSFHGAPYGCLGGFRAGTRPKGITIDVALGQHLPGSIVPLVSVGLANGHGLDTGASAWGANVPLTMAKDPLITYGTYFSLARSEQSAERFSRETDLYEFLQHDSEVMRRGLPGLEQSKINTYASGVDSIIDRRRRLYDLRGHIAKHIPPTHARVKQASEGKRIPRWEAHVANTIHLLKSGITNVCTLAAGMCRPGGSWDELGIQTRGHPMGHTNQQTNPEWLTLRRYNMRLLVQLIEGLKAVPEGKGTMMDNTLIVYSSCHGEAHHSRGNFWPFLLIGNLGGAIRSGRFIHYPADILHKGKHKKKSKPHANKRSVNAFYATLLHAVGQPVDWFNHSEHQKQVERPGPLVEVLA